ncbi:hypothetical protein CP965_11210 [Halarcobacter mediterraneus]|uniref:Uncharacterized protein n=1 Tax=Halarcobacter mediterraneus TaxID=2023153 RepID=A0A4Q1AWD7_9BACT|nr:hypothetical protein [Halarcobacter mediterraneus]RXK12322.1 hypothetical protein CP965_11210 [Halarcobacter mediterraneus]
MSSINDLVNDFNIGFFNTNTNHKNSINFNISENPKFSDFKDTLEVMSTEAYTPAPSKYVQLDGYTLDKNNNQVPTKITLKGAYAQDSFLDKYGNWDVKAENEAYKERELEYKKEVINEWLESRSYDLQNKAELMKALLEKVE